MPDRGRFIVVEGLEGAGKSTALHTIKALLEVNGHKVITTREPGGTRVGEALRLLIKESRATEPLDARSELLLMYAARVELVEHVIRPALDSGAWVVSDRFELSTWAYQGGGRKLDPEVIAHLSSFCLGGFKPDLLIFLDISPEEGLERVKKRGATDRIEQQPLSFFQDVSRSYHEHILSMDHAEVIDASQPLEVVQQTIRLILETLLH